LVENVRRAYLMLIIAAIHEYVLCANLYGKRSPPQTPFDSASVVKTDMVLTRFSENFRKTTAAES
jgi:hypothetical protein